MQRMGRCKRCDNGENSRRWVLNKEEKQQKNAVELYYGHSEVVHGTVSDGPHLLRITVVMPENGKLDAGESSCRLRKLMVAESVQGGLHVNLMEIACLQVTARAISWGSWRLAGDVA